jgi:alkylated DNA repair dioxygenase AlkB
LIENNLNQNLLSHKGELYYYSSFFSTQEARDYYTSLTEETPWSQREIKIFGKEVMQPRLMAWHGDVSYSYCGLMLDARAWSSQVLFIKKKVEAFCGESFNTALLNYYRDGDDSIGWHRDNEKVLGANPCIASVSFGAQRRFDLREYKTKENKISIDLESGSLVIMRGETQHFWEHGISKTKKVKEGRINITFRKVLTSQ